MRAVFVQYNHIHATYEQKSLKPKAGAPFSSGPSLSQEESQEVSSDPTVPQTNV